MTTKQLHHPHDLLVGCFPSEYVYRQNANPRGAFEHLIQVCGGDATFHYFCRARARVRSSAGFHIYVEPDFAYIGSSIRSALLRYRVCSRIAFHVYESIAPAFAKNDMLVGYTLRFCKVNLVVAVHIEY